MAVIDRLAKSVGEDPTSSDLVTVRRPNKRREAKSIRGIYLMHLPPKAWISGSLVGGRSPFNAA